MSPMSPTYAMTKQFDRILAHRNSTIIGPDGKPRNTRGLGYEESDDEYDDSKCRPMQYLSNSGSDDEPPTCDLRRIQGRAAHANLEMALRGSRGRSRGRGQGRNSFANTLPKQPKPNPTETCSFQDLLRQMKGLDMHSEPKQQQPKNNQRTSKASCHVIEAEDDQSSFVACSVCDRPGEVTEMTSCVECGPYAIPLARGLENILKVVMKPQNGAAYVVSKANGYQNLRKAKEKQNHYFQHHHLSLFHSKACWLNS